MIHVLYAKLRHAHNIPGRGSVQEFDDAGMYVTGGCLYVPGVTVLPLDLVGPMVPASDASTKAVPAPDSKRTRSKA